ncbi:hypothetical protein D3C87_1957200 [compost metagenome]
MSPRIRADVIDIKIVVCVFHSGDSVAAFGQFLNELFGQRGLARIFPASDAE